LSLRIVAALVAKDLSLFFRNKFFGLITALGLVAYIVIYFVLPSSVNETLQIGLYAEVMPPAFEQVAGEGLVFEQVESEDALVEAVTEGDYAVGVALPPDILDLFASGERPQISVYSTADTPAEVTDAVEVVIRELAYLQVGEPLAVDISAEVLGPDMLGQQIPIRDRMRPLLAVLLVLFEMIGLAGLITDEVQQGTGRALLVTPMTVPDLFAAKGLLGVGLAFGQAALFMAVVGGLNSQPLIILTALLLGAALVTGFAFLIASLSRDMMSSLGWGMVILIIFIIPAFGILFPGTVSGWAKVIPSYYLADTVHQASTFAAGWGDVSLNLLVLLGVDLAVVVAGVAALGRRFR
jgi:ABC-2 type transport system permease protein